MDSENTLLTDDHVAELLAKEASDHALRYSSMGLEAYRRSPGRPSTKAKPNTRFLRNIISQTKNHNEALLAKEAAEAQARLDGLAAAKAEEERKRRPAAQDLRRRQLGTIAATLQGGEKRAAREGEPSSERRHKTEDPDRRERSVERMDQGSDRGLTSDRRSTRDRDRGTDRRRHRKQHGSRSPANGSRQDRSRSPKDKDRKRHHSRRYRDRSPVEEDDDDTDSRPTSHKKHRSDRHRDREEDDDDTADVRSTHRKHRSARHRDGDHDDSAHPSSSHRSHHRDRPRDSDKPDSTTQNDLDSDPLEDLIGPLATSPKVRRKGRSAASGPSAMDTRFAASYDPKADIQPDSDLEGDDWADSLEALRDRAKWRRQGAERLRAAGFTDEQIEGWERGEGGAREKGVEDVRWAKSGEGREWDRGKADVRVGGLDLTAGDRLGLPGAGRLDITGARLDRTEGRLGWDRE